MEVFFRRAVAGLILARNTELKQGMAYLGGVHPPELLVDRKRALERRVLLTVMALIIVQPGQVPEGGYNVDLISPESARRL